MTRLFLFIILCTVSFSACKNDSNQSNANNATPAASTKVPPKSTDNLSKEEKTIVAKIKTILTGNMVESVDLNNGNLKIEYYKNATDIKAARPKVNLTEAMFKEYWAAGSLTEKVAVIMPGKILTSFPNVNNVEITIHTGTQTLNINTNREKIASFLGKTWDAIQKNMEAEYRYPLIQDVKKRKAFFNEFVTTQ